MQNFVAYATKFCYLNWGKIFMIADGLGLEGSGQSPPAWAGEEVVLFGAGVKLRPFPFFACPELAALAA
jgi:hypothetical protein